MVRLAEAEKLNKMSTLLERLHAKYNQNRPWTETMKLVRQVMVRRAGIRVGGCWSSFAARSVVGLLDLCKVL